MSVKPKNTACAGKLKLLESVVVPWMDGWVYGLVVVGREGGHLSMHPIPT